MPKAHLTLTLSASGLQPHQPYGASIDWATVSGHGANVGISDQLADQHGHVVFPLNPTLLVAVAQAEGPGDLTLWVRHGGTEQDAPPVTPAYRVELPVA